MNKINIAKTSSGTTGICSCPNKCHKLLDLICIEVKGEMYPCITLMKSSHKFTLACKVKDQGHVVFISIKWLNLPKTLSNTLATLLMHCRCEDLTLEFCEGVGLARSWPSSCYFIPMAFRPIRLDNLQYYLHKQWPIGCGIIQLSINETTAFRTRLVLV